MLFLKASAHDPAQVAAAGEHWRAPFELIQAALAFDVRVELGFAGPGLQLLALDDPTQPRASARAFASLGLLGLGPVHAPLGDACTSLSLPIEWLDADAWRAWLRAGPLELG